jgi:hypothetical protein
MMATTLSDMFGPGHMELAFRRTMLRIGPRASHVRIGSILLQKSRVRGGWLAAWLWTPRVDPPVLALSAQLER